MISRARPSGSGYLGTVYRYWHTIRYLKPVQIYGRLWFRLRRPAPDLRPVPELRECAGQWALPARRRPSLIGPGRFCFLNETHELRAGMWDDPALPRLWRYNLHYFDDLNAQDVVSRRTLHAALLVQWVHENPPGTGSGWEPYPASLRIVNWIKWALAGNALPAECVQSLAVQARHLTRRLEFHLLGNHLFANAKALVFAGMFFDGEEAARWLETGMGILAREIPEQILADGGQFERSTMYHALAFEDMLDLINVRRSFVVTVAPEWLELAARMQDWLVTMCHPDGEIAFFNDAAFGIAPTPGELGRYAAELGVGGARSPGRTLSAGNPASPAGKRQLLEASGYARAEVDHAVLIMDVAPVGPDYLPGHAHADTLSFELSVFGQRVIVNSGTSAYGLGAERLRQRGTGAHSTVQIDGADSSEVWSGFRVARRARPVGFTVSEDADVVSVTCAHDGYRRLPGCPVHRRSWEMTAQGLRVVDSIDGSFREAVARFYLHPDVSASIDQDKGILNLPAGHTMRWSVTGGSVQIVAATWHPEFGQSIASTCIELVFNGPQTTMEFFWA
ncbi:MAG: alginate lyase family protein [Sulfuritalea sp.]|nr:alginate lyase family protein [Sulfuritalea sp.]